MAPAAADAAKPGTSKSFFSNPLVLIGGGAIVLFIMLKSGGGGGGSVNTSSDTASQVSSVLTAQQQAIKDQLSEQNQTVLDALKQQSSDNAAAMQLNADKLSGALNLAPGKANAPAQASNDTATQTAIQKLQAQIDALKKSGGNPFGFSTTVVDVSPNSANATAALNWSKGIGVPYEWGLGFIQHFGRLPSSIAELNLWRQEIGNITSDGKWCINGQCI